jgi:hypothetical protein
MVETRARHILRTEIATSDSFLADRSLALHSGEPVEIQRGALVGMRGVLIEARGNGRWMVELLDAGPGLFVCIDESALVVEPA